MPGRLLSGIPVWNMDWHEESKMKLLLWLEQTEHKMKRGYLTYQYVYRESTTEPTDYTQKPILYI